MFRNDGTCWVIVAKLPAENLSASIATYFAETSAADNSEGPAVDVVGGSGDWALAWARNPDHAELEQAVALHVSLATPDPVFVLTYCDEDHGAPGAYEYRKGECLGRHDVDYEEFLRVRGCALPPDQPFVIVRDDHEPTVAVFEGSRDVERIRVYLEGSDPDLAPIRLEKTHIGLPMVRWRGGAPWGFLAEDLDDPKLTIYDISHDTRTGRLAATEWTTKGRRRLESDRSGPPTQGQVSIKGATTPEGVIDALGIPREALGLP